MTGILFFPLNDIYPTRNIRDDEKKLDLASSLDKHGQLDPILVYPYQYGYAIKDGHQRFDAARRLGWEAIKAVVIHPPDDRVELLVHQVIINEHRKGLSYMEKARVYQELKELGQTQAEIAKNFNITNGQVSLALSLLDAAPAIQKLIEQGRISPSAIEPILAMDLETQETLAPAVAKAKTVRRVKALTSAHKRCQELTQHETVRETDIPVDVDPLEQLALEEAQQALRHLENVTRIQHPSLEEQLKIIINRLAARLTLLQLELERSAAD